MQLRPATTVVEVLVALVVFSVAALGSAATLALAARARLVAEARREAVAVAQLALAQIATTPCAARSGGQRDTARVTLRWAVTGDDTLTHATVTASSAITTVRLVAELPCD